jgi:hypothetical protein
MRLRLLCLALLVVPLAIAAENEKQTIKIKHHPDEGKSTVTKSLTKETGSVKVLDKDGNVIHMEDVNNEKEEVSTETVLEKGDKKPLKYKVAYEKATYTKKGEKEKHSYDGKTLIYTLKDGKYTISVEGGGTLDDKEEAELLKKANEDAGQLMPGKPVAVGDKWELPSKFLLKNFGEKADLNADKTKGTATLKKVFTKDGKTMGVIEFDMNLAIKTLKGEAEITFDPPVDTHVTMTLETAIDGSSATGTMTTIVAFEGKGTLSVNGMDLAIELKNKANGSASTVESKGK